MRLPPARGALIINQMPAGLSKTLRFQYNPETIRRELQPQVIGGQQGDKSQASYYAGAPTERISLELLLDCTEALGVDPAVDEGEGLLPQLDAFEILLYPGSPKVLANTALLVAGVVEVLPYHAPSVVLVLGRGRSMPVRLTSYSVTEELINRALNPIRARVSLSVDVVTYSDVSPLHPDYARFLGHQVRKELRSARAYERLGVSVFGLGVSKGGLK